MFAEDWKFRTRGIPGRTVAIVAAVLVSSIAFSAFGADALTRTAMRADDEGLLWSFRIAGDLNRVQADGTDLFALDGFSAGAMPGEPVVPRRTVTFLLPEDVAPESVKVKLADAVWEDVPGVAELAPAPPAATEMNGRTILHWTGKDTSRIRAGRDTDTYARDAFVPAGPVASMRISKYRHWNLCRVELAVVAWNPVQKTTRLLRSASVRVAYTRDAARKAAGPAPARRDHFWKQLAPRIENPGDRAAFYDYATRSTRAPGDIYDYVVITASSIWNASSGLRQFVEYKTAIGHRVLVVQEGAFGPDTYAAGGSATARALNIRTWLQTYYQQYGIEYVLLVGNPITTAYVSGESVPMMMCCASGGHESIFWTPTDMCYAELSGNWDLDQDTVYGEWPDDMDAGGVDQDGDVAVGRIPYYGTGANVADLNWIMQKQIDYQVGAGDQTWRARVLIPAAISNFGPQDGDNDGSVTGPNDLPYSYNRVFGDTWAKKIKSLGGAAGFQSTVLLEKIGVYDDGSAYSLDSADAPLSYENLRAAWLNHYGYVIWWGHGSNIGAYRRAWVSDATIRDRIPQFPQETADAAFWINTNCLQLSDYNPSFVIQISCSNGTPEMNTNLGYALLLHGAIGTVSATRVSWYATVTWATDMGETYGDNASYAYQMFKQMSKSFMPVATALNEARSAFGFNFGEASWMNMLDFNVYGSPDLNHASIYPHHFAPIQPLAVTADDLFTVSAYNYHYNLWTNSQTDLANRIFHFDFPRNEWVGVFLYDYAESRYGDANWAFGWVVNTESSSETSY